MPRFSVVIPVAFLLCVALYLVTGCNTPEARSRVTPSATIPTTPATTPEATTPAAAATATNTITYSEVEPIFTANCAYCHSGVAAPEQLSLDSYAAALEWRERARIVPGQPAASELVRRLRGQARPSMPFNQPLLAPEQIALIETWILKGARAADGTPAPVPVGARVRLHGTLDDLWVLDGLPLMMDGGSRVDDNPQPGSYVQVRGDIQADGSIRVERIRGR